MYHFLFEVIIMKIPINFSLYTGNLYIEDGKIIQDRRVLISRLINYIRDPLRKNSLFLISTNIILSVFGFFFWIVVARFYPASDVGLATAIISSISLLAAISGLGFNVGLIRFLPDEVNKPGMINSCFTIVGLFSFILTLCFVGGLNIWLPALHFLQQDMISLFIFILINVIYSTYNLQNFVFIALRRTEFSFIQSLIAGLRIIMPVFLVGLGAIGIGLGFGTGFFVSSIAAFFFIWKLRPSYRPIPIIHKKMVNRIIKFSFVNYIAENFRMLPDRLWPILLVNIVNPEKSAYFYIAWLIGHLLFAVSLWTGSSLLAEISHNPEELRYQVIKAGKFILLILLPAIIILFLFGHLILSLFGPTYIATLDLLHVLAISSIPLALNELYATVCRFDKNIIPIIIMRVFTAFVTIGLGYFLLEKLDLTGIGIAWLASQTVIMFIVLPILLKRADISIKELLKSR